MLAEQSLREGDLDKALAQLQDSVRNDPACSKYRVFLFQLLSVMGSWERALNQLKVAGELDAGALAMVQAYREALRCEALRADVFSGHRSPLIFGEPEHWLALLIEALRVGAEGKQAQAQALRQEAFEAAPTTSGTLQCAGEGREAESFDWIADADGRLGPVLEAVVNGRYYWVPFHRINEIQLEAPQDLRDFVWQPAQFTWATQGQTVGFIPTRYPGTETSDDDLLRLARKTLWVEEHGAYCGLGQRMLTTDAGEYSLLDIRRIQLNAPTPMKDQGASVDDDAPAE